MADNYTFKDASGNTITHASKDVGSGVQATRHVDVDEANVAIAKAEDAAHSSGDTGYMLLAVRQDTATALAGTDGDYIPLIVDSSGRLHVTSADNAAGDVAHDAVDSGNPVKVGGKAASSAPTAVSAGDRVNAYFDLNGRLVVSEDQLRALLPASLGQKAKAASLAVTLASDEDTLPADNSAFTAGSSRIQTALAGVYQTTISVPTAGRAALARITARRAIVTAGDYSFNTAVPATIDSNNELLEDIIFTNFYSLKLGSTDGATYGTTSRIDIPMAIYGYKNLVVFVANGATSHDQQITVKVYITDGNNVFGLVGEMIMTTTNDRQFVISSAGDAGLGGVIGVSPSVANYGYYSIPAIAAAPYIRLSFSASSAPTTGALARISIQRTTG